MNFVHETKCMCSAWFCKPWWCGSLILLNTNDLGPTHIREICYYHSLWLKFCRHWTIRPHHYNDVIMGAIASQITSLTTVYSTVYSDADQRKHQSSASLAFVRGIHPRPVNSPHKWPITRKMFPFDDVITFKKDSSILHNRNLQVLRVPDYSQHNGCCWHVAYFTTPLCID